MKGLGKNKKDETGAFMLIEAVIIYPIVFMVIFFTIYVGLYILQLSTLSAYAQKVAVLAAREVSYPGYRKVINSSFFETSAVEADFIDTEEGKKPYEGQISFSNKPGAATTRAYRYWYNPLTKTDREHYQDMLRLLTLNNSILNGTGVDSVKVSISCDNYVVAQFINVKVEQELLDFPILGFFGIDNPRPQATAVAPVSDTDELVRNTDFIVDSLEILANKLGVDTRKIKSTIKKCLKTLGLTE